MLNSYTNNKFNFNVNAVSGTLRKSHPKSRFVVRDIDSGIYVFDSTTPKLYRDGKEIVVLQVMLTGDKKCMIEFVNKEDFEWSE